MAKRYSKFHSNFILKKKHQETTKGTIWERDWVTIGAQHQIEKGKRIFYGDTNFLFTDNTFNSYKKRHKFSKWVAEWTYDEAIENSSPEVNVVTTNWESKDLRDFAYYGSCVELIKIAVLNIVKWFPGRIVIGNDKLYVGQDYANTSDYYTRGYILKNPFGLVLYRHRDEKTEGVDIENSKRYVYDSYNEYLINGEEIKDYVVNTLDYECLKNITKICEISILSTYNTLYFIDGYYIMGDIVYVEGDSPYTLYYTYVYDDGSYDALYPQVFGVYEDPVYIHKLDLNKVYVLVNDKETSNEGEEETVVVKEIVTFKWGDARFYNYETLPSIVATVNYGGIDGEEHSYYRYVNGDKIENGVYYYCWAWNIEHDDSQDYGKDIFTQSQTPIPNSDNTFIVSTYEPDMGQLIATDCPVTAYNEGINPTSKYGIMLFGYQNKTNEEQVISSEEYEKLNDEEQAEYEALYYCTLSVEEYLNINPLEIPYGTYFALNILEHDEHSIEPYFGNIGKIETLQEHPDNVTKYVNSLRGIEHLLLNNKTKPLYQATLVTPVETNSGYIYTEKFYTWPSSDGFIDVNSVMYQQYMDRLIETATIFDETWCDNLWRNMTHESIRNFDWTYKKEYVEGDEEAFIEGGKRMQDIIHIYGRIADELKRYIEGIKMTSVITYDGYNNMPSAEVSDKLEYRGWDVYSTIPTFKVSDEKPILNEEMILNNNGIETYQTYQYTGEDLIQMENEEGDDSETDDTENVVTNETENSYDYSTVMIDEGFMKTYIHKQYRRISHVDYYRLPLESRSKYMFDYIRVTDKVPDDNDTRCVPLKEYDAKGTDIISVKDYYNSADHSDYILRYQDVIISKNEYEEAIEHSNCSNIVDLYRPYQYVNKNDPNDILSAVEYNKTYWVEDYVERITYDSESGEQFSVFCKKKEIDGEIVCDSSALTFKYDEYKNFRRGKDKYEPYTYYKVDDIVPASDVGYSDYEWVSILTIEEFENLTIEEQTGYILNEEENRYYKTLTDEEYHSLIKWKNSETGTIITNNDYEQLEDDLKNGYEPIYPNGDYFQKGIGHFIGSESDGYEPYSIIINDYDGSAVYPYSSFYPYEYEHFVNNEVLNANAAIDLSNEDYSGEGVIVEDANEIMTVYEFNNVDSWQEDYFAFEYFKPQEQNSWVQEANGEGLTKYAWETIANMEGEEEIDDFKPYRYLNLKDGDTIITPEKWMQLPSKSEWRVVSYKCTLDDNLIMTPEELKQNVFEYRRLNIVPYDYYQTMSSNAQDDFEIYEPIETNNFDKWFNARNYAVETMGEQDIRFVKELMMLSNRMFATKGTRQGIDMIMSMFGFGSDTYTLTEKYHRIDINKHIYDDTVISKLQQAATIDEMAEDLYDEDNVIPQGTVPLDVTELHGVKYIIPYYHNGNKYVGDEVYFQSKGGWGYKFNNDGRYNYMETMSYLKVVGDISDLLSVNARSVNKNDIYYVISLANVVQYDKNPENILSHFFYLVDDFNPHLYRSWVNINMEAEETDTVMYQMAEKARYLDSIISNSMGNNPHTGYGRYDLGNNFIEYMKSPFKYYLDNYVLDAETRNFLNGDDATYKLVTSFTEELDGKVKDITDREKYNRKNVLSRCIIQTDRYKDDYDIIHKTEDDSILSKKQYYINDKTLIMTNKIDNDLYKKYFFEVIIHYLMQMIPSTTILVLKNFE